MEEQFAQNVQTPEGVEQATENQGADVVAPQDLGDEEFGRYVESIKNGQAQPEATTPKAEEEPKQEAEQKPFRSFATESDFQTFMNKTIGERLKSSRAEGEKYKELGMRAMGFYGGESPEAALEKLVDDLEKQSAEESGKSYEEFRTEQQTRIDAERYRSIQKEEERKAQAIAEIQSQWHREVDDLKKVIPDFDFSVAMQDEKFKDMVINQGMSVSSAYIATINSAKTEALPKQRVAEIGTMSSAGGTGGDMSAVNLPKDQFMQYIDKLKQG